jgi:hypothetical protein
MYFYSVIIRVVICISRSRNHSLTYPEKNCRRGHLRPRQHNLEDVKGFRGQGVHNIFCVSNIKMTFTLTAVVKSNGREIGFRGLFEVAQKNYLCVSGWDFLITTYGTHQNNLILLSLWR